MNSIYSHKKAQKAQKLNLGICDFCAFLPHNLLLHAELESHFVYFVLFCG